MLDFDLPPSETDHLDQLRAAEWRGLQVPPLTSVSAVRSYAACPRSYFYGSVASLETKHRSGALALGLLVHEIAADLRQGKDPAARLAAERTRVEAEVLSDEAREKAEAGLAVAHAVAQALPAFEAAQPTQLKPLAVESEFKPTGLTQLSGRIDMLVDVAEGPYAGRWVEDIKTHERGRDAEIIDKLPFDYQFRVYAAETGARGVIVTLIAKTAKRRRKQDSLQDYLDRIAEEYKTEPMIRRHFEFLPKAGDVVRDLAAIRAHHAQSAVAYGVHDMGVEAWHRNEAHCHARGRCPFLELCRGEGLGLYRERRHR